MLLQAAASGAREAGPFWNAPLWTWSGWGAVGSIGTTIAGLATLLALVFFGVQLGMLRRQARRTARDRHDDIQREAARRRQDFEYEHTPVLSVESSGLRPAPEHIDVVLTVHADGAGAAYNVLIALTSSTQPPEHPAVIARVRFMRATASEEVILQWADREQRMYPIQLTVTFTNMFGKTIRFRHTGYLGRDELRLTDSSVHVDQAGVDIAAGT